MMVYFNVVFFSSLFVSCTSGHVFVCVQLVSLLVSELESVTKRERERERDMQSRKK